MIFTVELWTRLGESMLPARQQKSILAPLVYETGLLIGYTHILFYFIFQLLVQKHNIYYQRGVIHLCY